MADARRHCAHLACAAMPSPPPITVTCRTANRRAFLLEDVSKITIFGSNTFKH